MSRRTFCETSSLRSLKRRSQSALKALGMATVWLGATHEVLGSRFGLSLVYPVDPSRGQASGFQVAGEYLYFTANESSADEELLRYDGMNTHQVQGDFARRFYTPSGNATLDDDLYFIGGVGDLVETSLFRTSGLEAVDVGLSQDPGGLWAHRDAVYFTYFAGDSTDPRSALGVYRRSGANVDDVGISLRFRKFRGPSFASVGETLYVSDGTDLWAVGETNAVHVAAAMNLEELTPMQGFLLFVADDELGPGLFRTDGTTFRRIGDPLPIVRSFGETHAIHVLGDSALFVTDVSNDPLLDDLRLMRTDGTVFEPVFPTFTPFGGGIGIINGRMIIEGQLAGGPAGLYATDGAVLRFLGDGGYYRGGGDRQTVSGGYWIFQGGGDLLATNGETLTVAAQNTFAGHLDESGVSFYDAASYRDAVYFAAYGPEGYGVYRLFTVPEPSTLLLLTAAAAGWRRRANHRDTIPSRPVVTP